jgi:hypothetical protein
LGIDISELLSDLYSPLPPYRFKFMLQKAYEFCGDVRSLGSALLSALEKKDAEELSLLRSKHERQMLKLTEGIKKQQIKELRENLKSAQTSLKMTEMRFEYYDSRPFENQNEKAQVNKLNIATGFNIAGQVVGAAAAGVYALPNFHQNAATGNTDIEYGGRQVGNALEATSKTLSLIGAVFSHEANMHSIQGGRERRMDDWKFQATQARKEIKQVEKQILAAEIRLDIAEKELSNHQKQQEQAEEIETFMQSKFTNKELYHWMVSESSTVYFQTYKMAVELAKMAQKCYRHEKGDEGANFVGASYWDNLKKGLLAGEKLQFDLRRMEDDYLRSNTREMEITKNISLKSLDPVQLDMLRYKGECSFTLPELLFDLDYPGHYYRRIKSLSISIPSVVGPYSGVNCTLTLNSSETRREANIAPEKLTLDKVGNEKQIALSSGQNDSGIFELNHNDERYLPFEYHGVVSEWKLEFPSTYEQFDRSTISDVIIHMRYTAHMDEGLKDSVNTAITTTYDRFNTLRDVEKAGDPAGMAQRIDIRREFPDLWHKFISSPESGIHELTLTLTKDHFPYLLRPLSINVTHLSLFCELKEELASSKSVAFKVGKVPTALPLDVVPNAPKGRHFFNSGAVTTPNFSVPDAIILNNNLSNTFAVEKLKELILVLHYEIGGL